MAVPDQPVRTTPLHSRHLAAGAAMAAFGGWDMPLWYRAGAVREHLSVILAAGLFDTSHMDVITIDGPATDFLNYAFTRDLGRARPNRGLYGAFLDDRGHCLDDAVLYPFDDGRYAVVANAGMGRVLREHLRSLPGAETLHIEEPAERPAKIDIQGPDSPRLVRALFAPSEAARLFDSFPYFSFQGDFDFARSDVLLADGTPVLLSRSGYTGELGFELFAPATAIGGIWDRLLEFGGEAVLPCGLAARDSLRTGAVLPLSHQDIGAWPFINHPWRMALPMAADGGFTKRFVGCDALIPSANPHTLAFIGSDPRRVDAATGRVIWGDRDIGRILTIVTDMAIGRFDGAVISVASPSRPDGWLPKGLACGFIQVSEALPCGTEVILADARRRIPVAITEDIRPDRTARKKL